MSLSEHLTDQLDLEVAASRRAIAAVPASTLGWRPHDKSWTTLELATHIANLVAWGSMILTTDEIDFASDQMKNWSPPKAETVEDAIGILDTHADQLRGLLEGMSDADLQKPWVMRSGDQVFSSESRLHQFSKWVLSHQSHHRGQLTVYLRLNDAPVPGLFGPSADEDTM